MDNHRAALWCWLQHLPQSGSVQVIHIDRHTDCLSSNLDSWTDRSQDVASLSLSDYLARPMGTGLEASACLFRWDNFLSLFIRHYGSRIESLYMATRKCGDPPERHFWDTSHDRLPSTIEGLINDDSESSVIVDLDLDYFVARLGGSRYVRLCSDDYIEAVLAPLRQLIEHPRCICATVALSPECCGGWHEAESLLSAFTRHTGYDIQLPRT
ncbi:MAG: hypothetical protein H7A55_06835 [Verrucomicrobiaceae bacterium]|nr:hypothetical protein [Verrucomicrobiaceae bacterium]